MRSVSNVILHFAGLLALKNKPQNLHYSINIFALLFLTLIFTIKVSMQKTMPNFENINTFIPILIISYESLFLAMLFILLKKTGKRNRFIQSSCNFLGISIISCIISPLIKLLPLQLFFLCLLKSWFLIINFHITKHAFNINQLQAVWTYLFINTIAIITITIPFSIVTALNHLGT